MTDRDEPGGTLTLSPTAESARHARAFVAAALAELDLDDLIEQAQLAVSELVTNAVLHADTVIELAVTAVHPGVRIEVCDEHPGMPAVRSYGGYATTGRGLALVAALATELGVERKRPTGKRVWFTLDSSRPGGDADAGWSAWDIDALLDDDEEPDGDGGAEATVVFERLPVLLWMAAQQHHDAVLRELVLYRAEHPHSDDRTDVAAAQQAEALLASAVDHALSRVPVHRPERRAVDTRASALSVAPRSLDITMPRQPGFNEQFGALQDVLDEAERLAAAGRMLVRPALPEIIAVRDWCCEQVIAQANGVPPAAWGGTDHEVSVRSDSDRFQTSAPQWDESLVADADRCAVAADDNNRIVAVSRPAADLLGWTVPALVGRRVVTLVPPRYREAHVAGFTRHLTTGESHVLGVELELPVLHADGREITCSVLIEQARVAPGRAVYVAWLTPVEGEAVGDSRGLTSA